MRWLVLILAALQCPSGAVAQPTLERTVACDGRWSVRWPVVDHPSPGFAQSGSPDQCTLRGVPGPDYLELTLEELMRLPPRDRTAWIPLARAACTRGAARTGSQARARPSSGGALAAFACVGPDGRPEAFLHYLTHDDGLVLQAAARQVKPSTEDAALAALRSLSPTARAAGIQTGPAVARLGQDARWRIVPGEVLSAVPGPDWGCASVTRPGRVGEAESGAATVCFSSAGSVSPTDALPSRLRIGHTWVRAWRVEEGGRTVVTARRVTTRCGYGELTFTASGVDAGSLAASRARLQRIRWSPDCPHEPPEMTDRPWLEALGSATSGAVVATLVVLAWVRRRS